MKRLDLTILLAVSIDALALVACQRSRGKVAGAAATSGGAATLVSTRTTGGKGAQAMLDPKRFATWNTELRRKEPGRDTVLVDLDAVDHNVAVVRSVLGPQFALRLVTKSLPSTGLLRHLMSAASTNRLMTFSEGVLGELLGELGGTMDALPVEGAERLLRQYRAATNVSWLVDTVERAKEYAALAKRTHTHLKIAVEIDVGLRRGGAIDNDELLAMPAVLEANKRDLTFVGLMGYDGHVPFGPKYGFDADAEFVAVHHRYKSFVAAGTAAYPGLFSGKDLVFDSGGSQTYFRYTKDLVETPVNEVAMGSGFVMPGNFSNLEAGSARAARSRSGAPSWHCVTAS